LHRDVGVERPAHDAVQAERVESVRADQPAGLAADAAVPDRSIADQDGQLGRSVHRMDVLQGDVAHVPPARAHRDREHQVVPKGLRGPDVLEELRPRDRERVMRVAAADLRVVEPARVGTVGVGLLEWP
jgi:hypothetical protein